MCIECFYKPEPNATISVHYEKKSVFFMYLTYIQDNEVITRYTPANEKNFENAKALSQYLLPLYEKALYFLSSNYSSRYKTSYLPKRSGGFRRVDAPDEELKQFQREVKNVFQNKFSFLFPACAMAYAKKRTTKMLAERHIYNDIIIKFDLKDFFSTCTISFIMDAMSVVYPFCFFNPRVLFTIIMACVIKIGDEYVLPQGSPTSPFLSNVGMIPFDYVMQKKMQRQNEIRISRKKIPLNIRSQTDKIPFFCCYSRYSDNIYVGIPRKLYFPHAYSQMQALLNKFNPAFQLNRKKYSVVNIKKSGGTFITGLMVNKNSQVTIGHKKKQELKATIFSFLADIKKGKEREKSEVRRMLGHIKYYKSIEPDFVDMIVKKYEQKLGMNFQMEVDTILASP